MKTLYRDLTRLVAQIGSTRTRIFGYKSTEANRLFIFYCIFGKIYFTDKVNRWVKYFWFVLNSFEVLFFMTLGVAYFWYETTDDLLLKINVANGIGSFFLEIFGFPLISYLYSDHMDTMIRLVDDIMKNKDHRESPTLHIGTVFVWMLGPMIMCFMVIYSFICFFDLVLFFHEEKAKNYLYYAFPTPLMQDYGTLGYFLCANGIATFFLEFYMFQLMSSLAILLQWNTVCCNELTCIKNDFDRGTDHLNVLVEMDPPSWMRWNREFDAMMQRGVERFQKVTLLINSLRGYVDIMGSFVVPTAFCYSVADFYSSTVDGLPFVLKVKFFVCFVSDILLAFVFYWIGQNLENSVTEASMAVYFTPWYWSVRVRKNIHVLQCQTQSMKNFTIIKVYGLLFNNFSRFLHGAFTCTNFLYKFDNK